jgi:plastocyanin domain-containing protein
VREGGGHPARRPEDREKLPLNEAVAVVVTFPKAGTVTYACGMDMIKGVVTVQ